MNKKNTRTNNATIYLVQGALIAAIYAALTYFLAPLSYGPVQFRFSEALTVLPAFTPAAIPGLTIGCLLANLSSPYGIVDIVFGTVATLLAAISTYITRKIIIKGVPILAPLFPVIFNGLIVGFEISYLSPEGFSVLAFLSAFLSVAFGEAVICFVLGVPLCVGLNKSKIFQK